MYVLELISIGMFCEVTPQSQGWKQRQVWKTAAPRRINSLIDYKLIPLCQCLWVSVARKSHMGKEWRNTITGDQILDSVHWSVKRRKYTLHDKSPFFHEVTRNTAWNIAFQTLRKYSFSRIRYNSVTDHMPHIWQALGSIPNTKTINKQTKKKHGNDS
jgi:hypothetical protein